MKKVFCPIDFSDVSMNATAYAAKIAQVSNAELVLFHEHSIWSNPEEFVTGSDEATGWIADELEEQALQISNAFHISCYAEVISSTKPLLSLLEERSGDIDLFVLGMDKKTDLVKDIFGSLAFRLIRNVRIPVVLVPENYTFQPIDRIVFAFDPDEERETPIDQLVQWADIWKSEIRLLEGVTALEPSADVADTIESTSHGIGITKVPRESLIDAIGDFMAEDKADLIALFVRHRKFTERFWHRSLIRRLEKAAIIPLFLFH